MKAVEYTWHVLAVRNLEISVRYFVDQLGFEDVRRLPTGKAFLKFHDFRVMLGECPDESAARETGDHAYFAYIVCQGIEGIYQDLVARQAMITSPLADKPWGMKEFNVETPDGHRMVFGETVEE